MDKKDQNERNDPKPSSTGGALIPLPRERSRGQEVWVPPGYELALETPGEEQESVHLRDHLLKIRRHWLSATLLFVICVGAAVFLQRHTASNFVPLYTATAKIRLSYGNAEALALMNQSRSGTDVQTQIEILTSRRLAAEVNQKLGPSSSQEEKDEQEPKSETLLSSQTKRFLDSMSRVILGRPPARDAGMDADALPPEARRQMEVSDILASLSVLPVEYTDIIDVAYSSPDREFAARAANEWCDTLIEYESRVGREAYSNSLEWLTATIEELRDDLEQTQIEKNDVGGGDPGHILALESMGTDIYQWLNEAKKELSQIEGALNAVQDRLKLAQSDSDNQIFSSLRLDQLKIQLETNEQEFAKQEEELGPGMPLMKDLATEQALLKSQILKEEGRLLDAAVFEEQQLQKTRDALKAAVESYEARLIAMEPQMTKFGYLERNAEISKALHDGLLKSWQELNLLAGIGRSNVSVLEYAEVPFIASKPPGMRIILVGLFAGLLFGIGITYFLDYMDRTVKSPSDIEKTARAPVLACIPRYKKARWLSRRNFRPALGVFERPTGELADRFRILRTSLMFQPFGRVEPQTILVTSPYANEGKTTVAINLATAFAQRGERVLLVEADMMKPTGHKILTSTVTGGLSTLLQQRQLDRYSHGVFEEDGDLIVQTPVENLFFLPSGPVVSNSLDLLDSSDMRQLLVMLAEYWPRIIIDSPPAMETPHSSVIAREVDGIILVVRPGKTPAKAVSTVSNRLRGVGGNLLGLALNNPKFPMSQTESYYASIGARHNGFATDVEVLSS